MKIVYAADNRWGAAHQLQDFIKNTSHEVKVAAYPKSGRLLPFVDWNLDAAKHNLAQLQVDIKKYYPDFILIDGEPIVANIAARLDIPILYCSPLHLLDGLTWRRGQREYSDTIEQLRRRLHSMPFGVAKIIYAPYGDLSSTQFQVNEGFEWVQPYHAKVNSSGDFVLSVVEDPLRSAVFQQIYESSRSLKIITDTVDNDSYLSSLSCSRTLLTEGGARAVADGIYNDKYLVFCPQAKDPENVLNATICSNLGVGANLGQVELTGALALSKIESATELTSKSFTVTKIHKKLHERIDELWECM